MDAGKKAKLEARGYWVGDAEDFLGLSGYERAMVELRLTLSRAIRAARERRGMSQADLAGAMGTSQPRLSRIEAGYPDASLELMLRALDAAGSRARFHFRFKGQVIPARATRPSTRSKATASEANAKGPEAMVKAKRKAGAEATPPMKLKKKKAQA